MQLISKTEEQVAHGLESIMIIIIFIVHTQINGVALQYWRRYSGFLSKPFTSKVDILLSIRYGHMRGFPNCNKIVYGFYTYFLF